MKVLFFDIDGTLMDSNNEISASTRLGLSKCRQQGHKLFLCTGRTESQVLPQIRELGFDGIVAAAGAEVRVNGQIIYQHFMDPAAVEEFLDFMEKKHCSYGLQTAEGTLVTREGWDKTMERFIRLGAPENTAKQNMSCFEVVDSLHGHKDTYKLFYNFIPETVDQMREILSDGFHIEQSSYGGASPNSAEITAKGIDKGLGMARVMEYYGLTAADAIAFGDGPNDLEMMNYAAVSVCMGNGREEVKQAADLVTEDIFHDGIYKAMIRLKLFV